MPDVKPRCTVHPETELQCPKCIASRGGQATAKKHKQQLKRWGRKGGRAAQKLAKDARAKTVPHLSPAQRKRLAELIKQRWNARKAAKAKAS